MNSSKCDECGDYWQDIDMVSASVNLRWKLLCFDCYSFLKKDPQNAVTTDWFASLSEEVADSLRPIYLPTDND